MQKLIFSTVGIIRNYEKVNFYLGKESCSSTKLASFCVASLEKATPVFFVPQSLPEETCEILRSSSPVELFLIHSPALGKYEGGIRYKISYWGLAFFYFYHFLRYYLKSKDKTQVFLDIGIGFNPFVQAEVEALRYLKLFSAFFNIGNKSNLETYLFYSEPVRRGIFDYLIYREKFTPMVRYFSPLSWKHLPKVEKILETLDFEKEFIQDFVSLLERGLFVVTSVFKNIPLFIYAVGYDELERIISKMKDLLRNLQPVMGNEAGIASEKDNGEVTYPFDFENKSRLLINIFIFLSLYYGIANLLKREGVPSEGNADTDIASLEKKFESIYRAVNDDVNIEILKRDLKRLKKLISNKSKVNYWMDGNRIEAKYKDSAVDSRNFWAHSGLLTQLLEINTFNKRIRYKKDKLASVKNLIKELGPPT